MCFVKVSLIPLKDECIRDTPRPGASAGERNLEERDGSTVEKVTDVLMQFPMAKDRTTKVSMGKEYKDVCRNESEVFDV